MKNFSILTLLAALLFMGCSDIFVEQESPLINETTLPDLTANFADDGLTRTYVEAGKYLRWHEADLITAFFGNTLNRQYKFNGATGANSGTFSLVPNGELGTGNTLDAIYAIYPYDASATISDEGLISLTLPSEQSYAENSFGKGANTMIAVTESVEDTFLSFKNACGYLKLYLYNVDGATLKSVSVKGNNNEKIAGAATVAMTFGDTPEVTMNDDATTSVTLDCGEGIALGTTSETATALWIVLPETTFENGITITVTDTEGGVFEKSTSNSVAITRNDIQPMTALAVEFVAPVVKPANNEIWYTNGSTTEATTPYKTDVFGVNIVSNTYDAEKECWVIEFDGEVTTIGNYAFNRCSTITSVTIPESVTTIDEGAFYDCSSLTSVYITDIAAWCNISFAGPYSNPLLYAGNLYLNNELVTDLIIPDGATKIGSYAFYGYDLLTSVTIPDSVTSIGSIAFYDCTSLTSVTIPGSVTSIGYSTFSGCTSLTSVTIPDSVTSIDDSAFQNCTSLTSVTIGNGVTSIGYGAFSNCFSLTSVYITDIAAWCNISFGNSSSNPLHYAGNLYLNNELVTDLIIPDGVTSIGDRAFYGCISLTSVTIPDSVTSIGYEAFYECTSLTSVTIPDSVTKIGDYAFYDCTSLTSITIPDSVTSIGNYAFYRCTSLTSVTIPDSVTSIGSSAFSGCTSLTSVTIPDSVTKISDGAFRYCTSLKEVYCKPTTQPSGGTWMFDDNASGRKIYVPSNSVSAYKSASGWSSYASDIVAYDFENGKVVVSNEIWYTNGSTTVATTPNKTDAFGANILSNTYDAEKECWVIKFDGEVTTIGNYAFNRCSTITSVTIPESVTSIGTEAFNNTGITGITIPESVTSIGSNAFDCCYSLTSVYITDIAAWCNISFGGPSSNPLFYAGNLYLNNELITDLIIPDGVTKIGRHAFYGYTSLKSITIPDSVTSIGDYAFSGYDSLTSVYITDIAAWCNISFGSDGSNPLWCAENLYLNNELVTDLIIPDSVTSIGDWAFYKYTSLTSVTIPDSVTSIGDYAFFDCSSLTSVTIGNGVTSIGYQAFSSCDSLKSITIPDSVTSIGTYAFSGCNSLTSVTIGNGVTSIGNEAFGYCNSLKEVYCKPTAPPTGGYSMFFSNASGRKIYVPSNSVSAYKSASVWSDYASAIVGYDF